VPFPVQPDVEASLILPQNRGTTAARVPEVVPTHRPRLALLYPPRPRSGSASSVPVPPEREKTQELMRSREK
jgi:hypothetical protein